MKIERTVETRADPRSVFAYLSDFTNTEEWEPGTVTTTLQSGDGGVSTAYVNVSRFLGRRTTLLYTVTEHEEPHRLALRGENATVIVHDTMEIAPDGAGSRVTYTAEFAFRGWAGFVAPLLAPALRKLGDDAERGLAKALDRL